MKEKTPLLVNVLAIHVIGLNGEFIDSVYPNIFSPPAKLYKEMMKVRDENFGSRIKIKYNK
jgi:hypothetical protein